MAARFFGPIWGHFGVHRRRAAMEAARSKEAGRQRHGKRRRKHGKKKEGNCARA
jgi:hypothetical protein